jgi:hypothetical protein
MPISKAHSEEAIRAAMMIDAQWQNAAAAFQAACDDGDPAAVRPRQKAVWDMKNNALPDRRGRRNAQKRAARKMAKVISQQEIGHG